MIHLTSGLWKADITQDGYLTSFRDSTVIMSRIKGQFPLCEVWIGDPPEKRTIRGARLIGHSSTSAEFEAELDATSRFTLRFLYELGVPDEKGTALTVKLAFGEGKQPGVDVKLLWFWGIRLPSNDTKVFAPLFDGRGLRTSRARRRSWTYLCAGGGGEGERLALPAIDECVPAADAHVTYVADPFFSTGITLPPDGAPDVIECLFRSDAGHRQFPERVFGLYVHRGDVDTALEGFFTRMLPDIPPGPAWLHDVAMVHYDYLSENGEGWFRDIDRLVDRIPREDLHRIVLTLHGWYDLLGRYCYDGSRGKLDRHWMVMPGGAKREFSLAEIHRRIDYAKERGFRVLLYYADGLAVDSAAPDYDEEAVFREPDGSLRTHHWGGPDTIAQTYVMNPLHPGVQDFFRGYTRALLEEFGGEVDGFTWDETFTTRLGDISRGAHGGYADRAFMLLCRELRHIIKQDFPAMAFLASDATGLALPQGEEEPYWRALPAQNALVFDGTYQDSQCYPTAWQYGLFPNHRNVLWSCNWKPVENFEWTVLGVRAFGAPVAISNGWGENKGVSRYSEGEIGKLMNLFRERKERRERTRWIECADL